MQQVMQIPGYQELGVKHQKSGIAGMRSLF